jgi:hypothetical protein
MGTADFFAAIVFVGFLAALRAAGLVPAAFFFGARRALLAATLPANFLLVDFFAAVRRLAGAAARFLAADFFAASLRPVRFAGTRPARFADFLLPGAFLVAIRRPPKVKKRS